MKSSFPEFAPIPANSGFAMDNYWIWCGSAVADKEKGYHLYASRWRKDYPMLEGYVLFSHIVHAYSENLTGPYTFVEKVLPAKEDPEAWDGKMTHNPTILQWGGKYYLFYIGSTYSEDPTPSNEILENRQMVNEVYARISIGIAVSDSPAGPWKAEKDPILVSTPGGWDEFVVTNPAPCITPEGKVYLYYRTNAKDGCSIGCATADTPLGPYTKYPGPVHGINRVEDPFVWHDGEFFNMVAKDLTGNVTGEYHAGAHFVSRDGFHWEYVKKAWSRTVVFADGSVKTLGSLERPQIFFDKDGKMAALFAASADGPGHFTKADNTWNMVIPFQEEK